MEKTAADIMRTDFSFVDSDATVAEAEEYFEHRGITALPVLNPDRTVFGVLTPQNLAHFHRRPLNNPRAFHAWEICDARPPSTSIATPIEDITEGLLETNCSHVLVIDEERRLVGVISTELLLEHNLPLLRERDHRLADRSRHH